MADKEIKFASIKIPCRECLGVCHCADKHRLKQQKQRMDGWEVGGGGGGEGCSQSFLFHPPHPKTPLSPGGSTHLITDVTNKTRGSTNAANLSCPASPAPPQPQSGNRRLTAQHAVQISSGSENVSPPGVEASAGACQLPGPSSCTLMSFPSV